MVCGSENFDVNFFVLVCSSVANNKITKKELQCDPIQKLIPLDSIEQTGILNKNLSIVTQAFKGAYTIGD